ncbi:MAG: hypothetical protein PVJ33_06210 [Lysobacterales bacterium]
MTTRCSISPTGSESGSRAQNGRPWRALLTALVLLAPAIAGAYETDQFTGRLEPIADSTEVLDQRVNQSIDKAIADWHGPRDDWKVVQAIFHDIGGYYWVDHIEHWAMKSDKVDKLNTDRYDSIYHGHPIWATRVAGFFGVGPTIKLNGQLIGSDKLGHFLSQGRKFYARYLRYHDEAKAAERSAYTERALFGQLTTGVYSNADLVANYEGYRFYRSLFEDDVIPGKPAILKWEGDHWMRQRRFTFADHVNAYWDEALNIDDYDGLLYPYMKERLMTFCPDYYREPGMYDIKNEARLKRRYADLQLRDASELRLSHLCPAEGAGDTATRSAARSH